MSVTLGPYHLAMHLCAPRPEDQVTCAKFENLIAAPESRQNGSSFCAFHFGGKRIAFFPKNKELILARVRRLFLCENTIVHVHSWRRLSNGPQCSPICYTPPVMDHRLIAPFCTFSLNGYGPAKKDARGLFAFAIDAVFFNQKGSVKTS